MILTPNQISEIQNIFHNQFAVFIATTHGSNFLTDFQKQILEESGFDWENMYDKTQDPILMNFQLGMLSEALGEAKVKNLSYPDLKELVTQKALPITPKDNMIINSIKMQSLASITSHNNKIFSNISGIIAAEDMNNKKAYEDVIKDKILEGKTKNQSIKKISSELGHATGDWSRNFNTSVEYISHSALNEGKTSMLTKKHGKEGLVYFVVQEGACKHCVKHYLTGMEGSEPKIFTISQLEANGSNIGKKVDAWQPTIHSMHPYCRCLIQEYTEGYIWDGVKFVAADKPKKKYGVKIKIGEKEFDV